MIELIQGDCLVEMGKIADKSIDMVLADPPYGTTSCAWDSVIDLSSMWKELKRVIKPNGCIALFGTDPFTSVLITSNLKEFKYKWIWDKGRGVGHLVAKYRPMQRTEDIAIFGKGTINYSPIMRKYDSPRFSIERGRTSIMGGESNPNDTGKMLTHKHPSNVIEYMWAPTTSLHPTQKPVSVLSYLIRTYTQEGDTVLDFTMGSGSTLVACIEEKRNGVGIELDEHYFRVASDRINEELTKPRTMQMELA